MRSAVSLNDLSTPYDTFPCFWSGLEQGYGGPSYLPPLIWQYCNHNLTCEASLLSKSWLWNAFPHRSKTFKTRIETEIKLWTHPGVIFSYSCVKAADQSVPVWSPFFIFFFFISSTVYKGKKSAQTSCWEVNNLRVLYWWCHSFHAPVSWLNSSEGVAMNSLL